MPTYQQLTDDVCQWLNRKDILSAIPGWVSMTETEIAETLRARCLVQSGYQPIDAPYITLPPGFSTMESIRDARTGVPLNLTDEWTSGGWSEAYPQSAMYDQTIAVNAPATSYRLVQNSIEFLPHPQIPDPPDPSWAPQVVLMGWYARPDPLVLPSDTNAVLEQLYAVYLFGVCKYGALFELDDDRTAQMDASFQQAITRANLWKQQSDYSGSRFSTELAVVF